MSDLRLPMHELTFDQLIELGRAAIPTIARGWTDHNVHDPGIMLMELVAWIAEAQMYSVGRVRRDERLRFAHLLGVEPRGPLPASGLVWPNHGSGADAPQPTWPEGRVVDARTEVVNDRPDTPQFFTTYRIALTRARLARLETRVGSTRTRDWTAINSRDGATFVPFRDPAVPDERLVLVIQIEQEDLKKFAGPLSIGVEIINEGEPPAGTTVVRQPRLLASLEDENGPRPLHILADTTGGLLKSGVIVLDINRPPKAFAGAFAIALRSASGGFLRSPRLQRVALNVLAVGQSRLVEDEEGTLYAAVPNQVHELKRPGLMFPVTKDTFKVEVFENGTWEAWMAVPDLGASGSADRHVELDLPTSTIHFGNGINGHLPQIESPIRVTYRVCDGVRGNLARNIRWSVDGISGEFGVNSEVMEGGSDARGLPDLRALARGRFRRSHPIVTSADLELAALSFADLGVERAREMPPRQDCRSLRGSRSLVVVGHHEGTSETATEAEALELLAEVRSRLAPRLPVGQRLEVSGPRYVTVRIVATLRAVRNANPTTVADAAVTALRAKLAVVAPPGQSEWPFGRDLTRTMVQGWLRTVEGVARVLNVELRAAGRESTDVVQLGPRDLPHYQFEPGDLTVEREPLGGAR